MDLKEAQEILNKNGYLLEDYDDEPITVDSIDQYNFEDYIGKFVNVTGDVDLSLLKLTELPIKFGTVGGIFDCHDNKLTTLEGSPKVVGGDFNCYDNKLTTLKGAPSKVGGEFKCHYNELGYHD